MEKPSQEWVDSLVAKRRDAGGYSDEELEAYRKELYVRWGILGDEPRAAQVEAIQEDPSRFYEVIENILR